MNFWQKFFIVEPPLNIWIFNFSGASPNAFSTPEVWLTIFVTTCVAVLPSITIRALGVVLSNPNKHKVDPYFVLLTYITCCVIDYAHCIFLFTHVDTQFKEWVRWAAVMVSERYLSASFILCGVPRERLWKVNHHRSWASLCSTPKRLDSYSRWSEERISTGFT